MGKMLATLGLVVAVAVPGTALSGVTLGLPGGSVTVTLGTEGLAWTYSAANGAAGKVVWGGDVPQGLRDLRPVTLGPGTEGVSVVGTRNGREGLYVLTPVWGGAELAGGQPWLEMDPSEPIEGYQWVGSDPTALVWSARSLWARTSVPQGGPVSVRTALLPADQRLVRVMGWDNGWAVVDLALTADGAIPSILALDQGRWTVAAQGVPVQLPGGTPLAVQASHPRDQRFGVSAVTAGAVVLWAWDRGATVTPAVWTLDHRPEGWALGEPGAPALVWWATDQGLAGQSTGRWGQGIPGTWTLNLPGAPAWVSPVFVREEGWRWWAVVPGTPPQLYRLEVRSDGRASVDRAGPLAAGTGTLVLTPGQPRWTVRTADGTIVGDLDPETPFFTPQSEMSVAGKAGR